MTTLDAPATRPRLHEIDLLRIIAALSVVLYHYLFSAYAGGLSPVAYPELNQVARYGYLGVDLFFVISGFVVLMSAWQRKPGQFLISRIVRLYPAYWVAVTLTAVVTVLIGAPKFGVTAFQYLTNLTMLNSLVNQENVDVVYWTLWSELRFYALILLLTVIGMTRRRTLNALWIWLVAIAVLESGLVPAGLANTADLVVQTQFAHYFVAGMALFLLHRFGPSLEIVLILGLSLVNAVYRGVGFADAVGERYAAAFNDVVVAVIIIAIYGVMTLVAIGATRRFALPWFAVLGSLTYPLYLIHAHIGFMLFTLLGPALNRWVLVIGLVTLMLLVAYAIHRLVERPLAPRLRRLLTRLLPTAAGPPRTRPTGAPADQESGDRPRGGGSEPPR
ncbi:acyltransferase family protein [Pseudonocardia sp. GCM10023141]|uniref:acyltransferase family protein n=1 Tax=Pseudonocardia sp. GCM10023141 TaxID=3252653 RepID=UPI00361983EA